jgi:hypothetical protein
VPDAAASRDHTIALVITDALSGRLPAGPTKFERPFLWGLTPWLLLIDRGGAGATAADGAADADAEGEGERELRGEAEAPASAELLGVPGVDGRRVGKALLLADMKPAVLADGVTVAVGGQGDAGTDGEGSCEGCDVCM